MGRFSTRLAPVFADFAGVEPGTRSLDVGAGTGALTAELVRRGGEVAAAEPAAAFAAALRSRFPGLDVRQTGAEELPWPDESFDVALAQLVVAFMSDAPAGVREMRRVARTVAVCMWDREGMEMLAAINRTRDALGVSREDSPYRSREEIEQLVGDGAELELLEVDADYVDFEDLWSALIGGAGPAGQWAVALDDEQRAGRSCGALPPARRARRAVHAHRTCVGRARYARVRTLSRSAPVPTSVTATSSSRSTKST